MLGALTLKLGGLDMNMVLLTNGGVGWCSSTAEHLSLSDKGPKDRCPSHRFLSPGNYRKNTHKVLRLGGLLIWLYSTRVL